MLCSYHTLYIIFQLKSYVSFNPIKYFIQSIIKEKNMDPTFLWTIGYNINPKKIKADQQSMRRLYKQVTSRDMNLFNDFLPFGRVFFSNEITKKHIIKLFDRDSIHVLENWDVWTLQMTQNVNIIRWEKIFSLIKQAQIVILQFTGLPMPNILKSINHIRFSQLKNLNLHSCGILSVESLSFIDAPNLKILNLIYNYVHSYKSLKKTNFKLDKLFLYSGKQAEIDKEMSCVMIDDSSRWNFSLQGLRLEKHFYNEVIMQDLSFLSKLENHKKFSLTTNISMSKRIFQKKLVHKYYSEGKIKLYIFQINDLRQFPPDGFRDPQFFDAFHIQTQQ